MMSTQQWTDNNNNRPDLSNKFAAGSELLDRDSSGGSMKLRRRQRTLDGQNSILAERGSDLLDVSSVGQVKLAIVFAVDSSVL